MLSGTGRHRRPRQAPAFLVTAGVTTAGLALPLLGSGAAQAVDGETWDHVATCESDGEWTKDTGNGFYGGLQLPLSLWAEFGGDEFAERPDLASRQQQIQVAERILAEQGPRAFPACSLTTGLHAEYRAERDAERAAEREERATADGDAESDGSPERERAGSTDEEETAPSGDDSAAERGSGDEDAAGERQPEERGERTPEADGTAEGEDEDGAAGSGSRDTSGGTADREGDRAGSDASDPSPSDSSPPDSSSSGTTERDSADDDSGERQERASGGRHRGDPDPAEAERAEERGGGRHASEGREAAAPDPEGDYQVARGDTLYDIAGAHEVEGGWPALYEANSGLIGEDPDHILPGQRLDLASSAAE